MSVDSSSKLQNILAFSGKSLRLDMDTVVVPDT